MTEEIATSLNQNPAPARLPWWITLFILTVIAFAFTWFPVRRAFAHYQFNFNEGWNAYRASWAQRGVPLYTDCPRYTITNYPPISFHLIGFLGRFTGNVNITGRCLSLLSIVLIAFILAAIVREVTGEWPPGVYAGLGFIIWLAVYKSDRVGMNDPQLFATVFSLLGVYAYVRRPASAASTCISSLFFAISIFTKHNLLAFPAAVAIHLVLTRSFKRLGLWVASFGSVSMVLLAATVWVDGPQFFSLVFRSRLFEIKNAVDKVAQYIAVLQIPLAIALVWSVWNWSKRERNVWVLALVAANAVAIAFGGGFGVDTNVYFDALIALVIVTAIAVSDLLQLIPARYRKTWFVSVLLLAPFLGVLPELRYRIRDDASGYSSLRWAEQDHAKAVAFLAAHPGPAACQTLLICFDAGKPGEVDVFTLDSELLKGRISEKELSGLVASHHFTAIELEGSGDTPPAWPLFDRFTMLNYRLALQCGPYRIFTADGK